MLKLTDMLHGLFILASVLTVVLVFNFFAIKAFKLPAAKRKKYRQIALVVYGFLMLCIGVIFLKSGENPLSGWFYVLFGIGFPVVSWMEYRTKKTHNSLRSRATGAPIISRYLATVRLAIG